MASLFLRVGPKDVVGSPQCPVQLFNDSALSSTVSAELSVSPSVTSSVTVSSFCENTDWTWFYNVELASVLVNFSLYIDGQLHARCSLIHSDLLALHGTLARPLVSTALDVIGTVVFSFHVVLPYSPPSSKLNYSTLSLSSITSRKHPLRIGHRGAGNSSKRIDNFRASVQENTLLSFHSASEHVQWLELDVQLTSDNIPVLLHDWFILDYNSDDEEQIEYTPIHDLSLKSVWHMTDHCRSTKTIKPNCGRKSLDFVDHNSKEASSPIPKSRSSKALSREFSTAISSPRRQLTSKDPLTTNPPPLPSIRDVIPTLEKVLKSLPMRTGLNIEVKYPDGMLMTKYPKLSYPERNRFCDIILDVCYRFGKSRPIIFSSFDPDVCSCLKLKQTTWPVFFLTAAGHEDHSDVRMQMLQDAVTWAKLVGLEGIVSECDALIDDPSWIRKVIDEGLVLFSYGGRNNDVEGIKLQVDHGIHGVISDSVRNLVNVIPLEDQNEVLVNN
ncbi:hypothetical protein GEMRC1_000762 [Eukaryota sp. GEM-RC1]